MHLMRPMQVEDDHRQNFLGGIGYNVLGPVWSPVSPVSHYCDNNETQDRARPEHDGAENIIYPD